MRHAFTFTRADAAVGANQLDIQSGIGHKGSHLFTGSHGNETGIGCDKRDQSAGCQTGCTVYGVLFGNAHVNEAVRVFLDKVFALNDEYRIGTNQDCLGTLLHQFCHGFDKCNTGIS